MRLWVPGATPHCLAELCLLELPWKRAFGFCRVAGEESQVMPDLSSVSTSEVANRMGANHPSIVEEQVAESREVVPTASKPLVSIRPEGRWPSLNLKDVWAYRELFYILIWRDLKVRYKQTILGVAWVVIQPLMTMLVFAFFFGRVIGVPSGRIPYFLFAFAGLVPWTFFASSVTRGGASVVGSAHLITKIYFPRLIIPAAAVLGGLLDFVIAFILLVGMATLSGYAPSFGILTVPFLAGLTTIFALGISFLTSAFNVKYRDITNILPFAIQMGMFATPIIYPLSLVPERWRWLFKLNPMTGIIEGFRSAMFGLEWNIDALRISILITLVLLVVSAMVFRRMEREFADVV